MSDLLFFMKSQILEKKYILNNLFINFAVRSPVELPEVKKVAENVANDVSHKPTMSGANRTQQVIVRNSSSIELQVSVPGINQDHLGAIHKRRWPIFLIL